MITQRAWVAVRTAVRIAAVIALLVVWLFVIVFVVLDYRIPPTFATEGPGWRLLFDGGGPFDDGWVARNEGEFRRLWARHTEAPSPPVDFSREVVVDFQIIESGNCPQTITRIDIDPGAATIEPPSAMGPPHYGRRGCHGSAVSHCFVVALDRTLFPSGHVYLKRGDGYITTFVPAIGI